MDQQETLHIWIKKKFCGCLVKIRWILDWHPHLAPQNNTINTFKDVNGTDQPPSDVKGLLAHPWLLTDISALYPGALLLFNVTYFITFFHVIVSPLSPSSRSPDKKHKKSFESGLPQKSPPGPSGRAPSFDVHSISLSLSVIKVVVCCWVFCSHGNKVAQACR